MTTRIILLIALLIVLFFASCTDVTEDDNLEVKTVGAPPAEYAEFLGLPPLPTTTIAVRPRARSKPTVRSASVGAPVVAESSIRGFPCGGDLPPCFVLRRESMMAADPPRVWNGNCYMPVDSLGQCGRSTASGLWQILRSTWRGFAGYVNAADAPVDVQNAFARQLWAGGAGCSAWSAC